MPALAQYAAILAPALPEESSLSSGGGDDEEAKEEIRADEPLSLKEKVGEIYSSLNITLSLKLTSGVICSPSETILSLRIYGKLATYRLSVVLSEFGMENGKLSLRSNGAPHEHLNKLSLSRGLPQTEQKTSISPKAGTYDVFCPSLFNFDVYAPEMFKR